MALGQGTFDSAGGAVSDLFAAQGFKYKAQGAAYEQRNYENAAALADKNEQFTEQSTAIKELQIDRSIYQTIGGQQADVATAGFGAGGTAGDLLRDSAAQGALTKSVAAQQGIITEEGYRQQAQSYRNLAEISKISQKAYKTAETGAYISAGIKAASSVASFFTP